MLRLSSIAVNRAMPMPGGLKGTTKFTVIAMYIAKTEDDEMDDIESTRYTYQHCDDWQQVVDYINANPIGSTLTTLH